MDLICFAVSLIASTLGGICGIGGGVIIKPVLDASGVMTVAEISFLSGCTVLAMAMISLIKNLRTRASINFKTATPLAAGAVFGGVIGKALFDFVRLGLADENMVGAVQAGLLVIVTVGTLVYSACARQIKTLYIKGGLSCCVIGLFLGTLSSFLGIGGGPINLTVLFFFFSLDIKSAAAQSLYIILFSQLAGLVQSVFSGKIPNVKPSVLMLMIFGGALGGILGNNIHRHVRENTIQKLYIGFMVIMICISAFNVFKYAGV